MLNIAWGYRLPQQCKLCVLHMGSNQFCRLQVTEDGKPACRTMGFAGFITGTQQALLQTHAKYAIYNVMQGAAAYMQ